MEQEQKSIDQELLKAENFFDESNLSNIFQFPQKPQN